ncbi:hypothetical protein BH10PSE1_BH10PSE1_21060 [soil metagenome]
MSRGWAAILAMTAALSSLSPAYAQDTAASPDAENASTPFSGDDLLFMEVTADGYQLAESMNAYASRSGVYLPLGEISRILDFAVGVFPAQQRAEGWVLSRDHTLVVDLRAGQARINGVQIQIQPGQAQIYQDDLYIRADLLEQLLPVRLKPDVSAQTLAVVPTTPLPFQQKLAREQRMAGTTQGEAPAAYRLQATPYALFSPPVFDVNVGGQVTRDGQDQSHSYDVRMAGDLFWAGFQGFVGSDSDGELNSARVLFERKDPDGHALPFLGGTRVGIGDVFTPSMALGAGSSGGRGFSYRSAPLESLDLATPLNLRGELPLGEDVELYVNEVLQRAQASPVQGRYEFLNVPLTFGMNTIRLVFYGSQGQTREQVRRINFGAGQVEAGKLAFRLGVVEQNTPVFEFGEPLADPSTGAERIVALFDYGVSPMLTISGGAARFTPLGGTARDVGLLGLHGSLGGVAGQIDLASDDAGGTGATIGVAARPLGVSVVGRHSEYAGGFVDETRYFGAAGGVSTIRTSDLRADATVHANHLALPLSASLRRQERTDDSGLFAADLRTSAPIGRYYVSGSVAYQDEWTFQSHRRQAVGAVDLATLVAARAQFRGGLTWRFAPDAELDTAYGTLDYQATQRSTVRFAVMRTLGVRSTTTLQASGLYSASRFDMALNAGYETESGEWRLGFQLGFGFGRNPATGRYGLVRPGVSSGGSVALDAFVDANGDGQRQADESGVAKVALETPGGTIVTDAQGYAMAAGLGDGAAARIRINTENIDDPFLVGGDNVQIVPRPGRTALINYPLQATSEVELTIKLRRAGQSDRPLAAVDLQLVPTSGPPVIGRTDHAGSVIIEGVRPGRYEIRLDPTQALNLGLALDGAPVLTISANGGYVHADDIFIFLTEKDRP